MLAVRCVEATNSYIPCGRTYCTRFAKFWPEWYTPDCYLVIIIVIRRGRFLKPSRFRLPWLGTRAVGSHGDQIVAHVEHAVVLEGAAFERQRDWDASSGRARARQIGLDLCDNSKLLAYVLHARVLVVIEPSVGHVVDVAVVNADLRCRERAWTGEESGRI